MLPKSRQYLYLLPHQLREVGSINLILQIKKLRLREVKSLGSSHTAKK